MTNPPHPSEGFGGNFHNGLHSGAGALTSSSRKDKANRPVKGSSATEEWVNEGGSLAPVTNVVRLFSDPTDPPKS
jgi:hypothetical protein